MGHHGDYEPVNGLSDMNPKRTFAEHLKRRFCSHDDQIITAHADFASRGRQSCRIE